MEILISDLQCSQLFLSEEKIKRVESWLTKETIKEAPITIRLFSWSDKPVILDGHTRTFVASQKGLTHLPVILDEEVMTESLEQLYQACVSWCKGGAVHSISDLLPHILPQEQYQREWIKRCQSYLAKLS
ncbi:MAG: hypothetical protein ACOYEB_10025 [Enterococcus lemanii]|jgi:hypothetical protein